MSFKKQAITFFLKHTSYIKNDIYKCVELHNGFTNTSYKVITKDKQIFQIRIANNHKTVNRLNEKRVYEIIDFPYFIYFDSSTGNAIKKWIDGRNPNKTETQSVAFLQAFANSLKKLHTIKAEKILKHNYFDCFEKARLPKKHKDAYLYNIKQFEKMPLVLSHNDLSADNLLYTKNQRIIFIDYEWSRMNNEYWDIANFVREVNLPINKIKVLAKLMRVKDFKKLLIFIYLTTNYAYQWTFNMVQTKKILKYRKITFKKLEKYFNFVNS